MNGGEQASLQKSAPRDSLQLLVGVDSQNRALRNRDFDHSRPVPMNDVAQGRDRQVGEDLVHHCPAESDRMAPAAPMGRDGHGGARFQAGDQGLDVSRPRPTGDRRAGGSLRWRRGRWPPRPPVGPSRTCRRSRRDRGFKTRRSPGRAGGRAPGQERVDHHHNLETGLTDRAHRPVVKRVAPEGQERFGPSYPASQTRRQHYAENHKSEPLLRPILGNCSGS